MYSSDRSSGECSNKCNCHALQSCFESSCLCHIQLRESRLPVITVENRKYRSCAEQATQDSSQLQTGVYYTVLYGVVWYGMVWCGVVWCGVVWCGVVRCGVVRCGVVRCGEIWYDTVWYGTV